MAEPASIFIDVTLDEKRVKKLLNTKFEHAQFGNKVGYYFSELLYNRNTQPENVFVFHYQKKEQKCFIAYLLNHFNEYSISHFPEILSIIGKLRSAGQMDYAIVASTYPEVLWGYQITDTIKKVPAKNIPQAVIEHLATKFWSFAENYDFPEPQKALQKRNYFYKNFKSYYQKYLAYIEETLKPEKIAQATEEKPYLLIDNRYLKVYTYNHKVYAIHSTFDHVMGFIEKEIEIPGADPYSLTMMHGILKDKNHVFNSRLAKNSPPATIETPVGKVNNPDAIDEYYMVEGIDGGSFEYLKEQWDTVYYRDKNAVFYNLKKIEKADRASFEYLDFCYGKDKYHVFHKGDILPIDVNNYTLNNHGFIYDDKNIFHYANQVFLDAKTFEVLDDVKGSNDGVNMEGSVVNATFIVKDKNGKYLYDTKNNTLTKE